MAQFVSALEFARYFLGVVDPAELDLTWIAQANAVIEAISDDIEAAAGVPIEAGEGTIVLPGSYSRDLELPVGPVRDVSAVTLDGQTISAAGWWYNDRSLIRRGWSPDDSDGDLDDVCPHQGANLRSGSSWGSPASTITVTLAWGYTVVPPFVKSLAKRIAARTIPNMSDLSQESLGRYSASYRGSAADGSHVREGERRQLRRLLNTTHGTIRMAAR